MTFNSVNNSFTILYLYHMLTSLPSQTGVHGLVLKMAFFSSVQFSCSVVSDSLQPHGLQYARLPCLSPTPRAHSNSCPLSWWSHPTISSSVVPFSSCLQSFSASESFPMSSVLLIRWPKYRSFSFNISPFNDYSGLISFRIDWLDLLEVQGTLKSLLQTTVQNYQFFSTLLSL